MRFPREIKTSMDVDDAIVELGNIASSPRNRRLESLRDAIYGASTDYEFENVLDYLAEFVSELRRLGRHYEADDVTALKDALYASWFPAPVRMAPNRRRRNSGSRAPFITDMGESPVLTADDGSQITLGRYGVWKWNGRKHEVVETGDDLAALQRKHGIADQPILLHFRRNGRR